MRDLTGENTGRHGDNQKRSRWSPTWQRAAAVTRCSDPLRDELSDGASRLSDRVVDLLADPGAGERLLRLTRLLVIAIVVVVAITGAVLLVRPEVLTAFASSATH